MKVLILAAGYGTRLYPLVKNTPKPLLLVAGKPILNHLLDKLKHFDELKEIIVVTNNKFYSHFEQWSKEGTDISVPIKIINDGTNSPDDRLGSVGDIHFVLQNYSVEDDLLVVGGDNLFDHALDEFLLFSQDKSPQISIGIYDIHHIERAKEFGVVNIDNNGKILSFEEKPDVPQSSLIAMCIYYFPQRSLPLVNAYLKQSNKTDKAGDYIHWLCQDHQVYGFPFQGTWYDIGSIESYKEAEQQFVQQGTSHKDPCCDKKKIITACDLS